MGVFARPQELLLTYFVLAAIGLAAAFGWSLRSVTAVLVAGAVLGLVHWRLAGTGVGLWQGLRLVAAWNPTGEAFFGMAIVLPRLVFATVYALIVVVVGLPLPYGWTRWAWLARLRMEPAARPRRR